MKISDLDKFKLARDIRIEYLGSEALVINLEEETIFSLNDTSAHIIKVISEGKTYKELQNILKSEYEVNVKEKENEITDLISQLINENILKKDGN